MDLQKIAQGAVKAATQGSGSVNFNFNDIHDNENVYVGSDSVTTSAGIDTAMDFGRLPLFVKDKAKLKELVRDLAVCEGTADVRLAVAKLANGKTLPSFCKEKTFAEAVLPFLKFETTESAIYQALKNISL